MKTWKLATLAIGLTFVLALLMGVANSARAAEPITLNCISAFPKSTNQMVFWLKDFMERIQQEADKKFPGELKLVYKGGPELVATNEQIIAIGKGAFDMAYTSQSFYVSKLPELDLLNMTPFKTWEERTVGLSDYVDKLHNEKTNTHYLGRNGTGITFQFGLTKPIKSLDDLKGMSIRGNPTTIQLVKALGANPVQMAPSELYTALERNIVQAFIMPAYVMRAFGVGKVTKGLLFPGFFDAHNNMIVNLDKWNKLPKHLQDFLTEQVDINARHTWDFNRAEHDKEVAAMKADGTVLIDLPKPEADRLLKLADDNLVQMVMERAPNEAKIILEYFQKKP